MNTRLILEILKKSRKTTDILLNILIGGFNYREFKRKALYPTLPDFSGANNKRFLSKKNKNTLYSLLSRLKKQGLVEKERKRKKTYWIITSLGIKRFEKLRNIFPRSVYKREKNGGLSMVIFDIPERYKTKRDWLRKNLLELEFTMLQKSVFIGKNKLPEEFLKDLADLGLIDFIYIFKITKTGTIKELNF